MQFDDRLATVLQMQAESGRAAETQYRQLLDLLGSAPSEADHGLLQRAYTRLDALSGTIPAARLAAIIREPGTRLRNPELLSFLAAQELPIVSAAVSAARLSALQWQDALPSLPVPARALLRHRRDLPESTRGLLASIGVRDLVLPQPEAAAPSAEPIDVLELEPALEIGSEENAGIGALVRRIEAFQRARANPAATIEAPLLPLGEHNEERPGRVQAFDFATDPEGRIVWADPALAPMTCGILLTCRQPDAPAHLEPAVIDAMRRRQPVRGGKLLLEGAPAIAGEWQITAAPHFAHPSGGFTGYRGRMRRPMAPVAGPSAAAGEGTADRMRQLLHELRTPINAIQGYAEVIHQQLFGPTPHEYRALAAAIAGDAARILAGFDELDRLAKLESGALELDDGTADLRAVVRGTAQQLDAVLTQRSARLELIETDAPCPVALSRNDAELLVWRLLATLAGAAGPGEDLRIWLTREGGAVALEIDLPASLSSRNDIFDSSAPVQAQAVTSGMFGAGFTLRLARAEARGAGGDLVRLEEILQLKVPLAAHQPDHAGDKLMDYGGDFAETR